MEPRISFVTLGVGDLARAERFYRDVLRLPAIPMPPPPEADVRFFEMGKTWLALYPHDLLAEDAGVSPETGRGGFRDFRGFTLAHNVRERDDVAKLLAEVEAGGGRIVKPSQPAFWGGQTGYFADPDGFLWEVAWNPKFPHV